MAELRQRERERIESREGERIERLDLKKAQHHRQRKSREEVPLDSHISK